jgi:hypothetical protein
VITQIPKTRAEAEDGVEPSGAEREARVAAAHEPRPACAPGRSPPSREQGRGAIEGDHAIADAGEREGVPAGAAACVEDERARLAADEASRRKRLLG